MYYFEILKDFKKKTVLQNLLSCITRNFSESLFLRLMSGH